MADYLIKGETLTGIANAIRSKTGSSSSVAVSSMASQIAEIPVGTDVTLLEDLPIELDFANGDMSFTAPDGYAVKSAIVKKPTTLIPANIAAGVEIAGIVGTHAGGGGGSVAGCVTVTFMNGDTVLFSRPVYIGDDCPNPLTQGHISTTPTKESTAQYDYTYSGWCATDGGTADSTILQNITEDKTVYAAYTATTRKYTITFYDDDGVTVLHTQQFNYNAMPSYNPTKSGYLLTGWTPALSNVTGDASYTAIWGTVLVIIPEQTVTLASVDSMSAYGQYQATIPKTGANLTAGAKYKVVLDGTEYTAHYFNGAYYGYYKTSSGGNEWKGVYGIGNPHVLKYYKNSSGKICTLQKFTTSQSTGAASALEDNGQPFWIKYDGGNWDSVLHMQTSGTHTIYVYQEAT